MSGAEASSLDSWKLAVAGRTVVAQPFPSRTPISIHRCLKSMHSEFRMNIPLSVWAAFLQCGQHPLMPGQHSSSVGSIYSCLGSVRSYLPRQLLLCHSTPCAEEVNG